MTSERPYMTSYLITLLIFTLSLTIENISANHVQCQMFELENEDKFQRENWTCAMRLEIFDSI